MTEFRGDDLPRDETIALLLDEVARLEQELRARDEAETWRGTAPEAAPETPLVSDSETATRAIEELTAELAGRDETIAVLLEQTRLFEEAAEAQRAEWEQLTRWVDEVEQRVEDNGSRDDRLDIELATERKRADENNQRWVADRMTWDAQRKALERERNDLRSRLAALETSGGALIGPDIIEDENRRLRETCAELERAAAAATEVEPLRNRLAALQAEVKRLREANAELEDDRRRLVIEHEAATHALKAQIARASLANPPATSSLSSSSAQPTSPTAGPKSLAVEAVEVDERIRTLREHLREIHQHEAEERASRKLSARLSRLWRHTAPTGKG